MHAKECELIIIFVKKKKKTDINISVFQETPFRKFPTRAHFKNQSKFFAFPFINMNNSNSDLHLIFFFLPIKTTCLQIRPIKISARISFSDLLPYVLICYLSEDVIDECNRTTLRQAWQVASHYHASPKYPRNVLF